jgi:Kef-type K+ transport system membrane component KefB
MDVGEISLLYLGIALILSKLAEEALGRLNMVRFVGPIIVGIIMGQGVLGLIKLNDIISFITSLGIVFLLFLAGAEEIGSKLEINSQILASALVQISVPLLLISLVLNIYTLPLLIPLAMTSAGPLTRLLIDVGISKERVGVTIFEQAVIAEIIAVVAFATFLRQPFLISFIEVVLILIFIILLGSKISLLLEKIEGYIKVREIEFASIISLILIIGFLAEYYNFNSAIAALFLGFLLRDYFKDRAELLEKLHAFTYGFFEPLFFFSIGLYFVKITPALILISLEIFSLVVIGKFLGGLVTSRLVSVDPLLNALGTSTKGGVDASLLITALTVKIINGVQYSEASLAVTLSALIFPLLFRLRFGSPVSQFTKPKLWEKLPKEAISNVYASCDENLRSIINKMVERGLRAIVVVNEYGRPLGYISVSQLLEIDPSDYERIEACELPLNELRTVEANTRVIDVLRRFRESEEPVIGVIKDGRLVGVIYERELLRILNPV